MNRVLAVILVWSLLVGACSLPDSNGIARRSGAVLHVLGRAQDGGLPHLGCDREACCAAARRSGRVETPTCLGIHDRESDALYLLEATPAIETQITLLHKLSGVTARGRRPVDGVVLTHAHLGHYLGLAWFGREVAATQNLPLHLSERFADYLRANGPWSQLIELGQIELHAFEPGSEFELGRLRLEAIAVPHRDEFSDTMAFCIHGPRRTVLFCPDIDAWERNPGLLERLLEGVDIAYLDATFYDGRELPERARSEIPHPPMVDTMDRLREFASDHPGAVRFIHLNHTNPAWNDPSIAASIEELGFAIAQVGEAVEL